MNPTPAMTLDQLIEYLNTREEQFQVNQAFMSGYGDVYMVVTINGVPVTRLIRSPYTKGWVDYQIDWYSDRVHIDLPEGWEISKSIGYQGSVGWVTYRTKGARMDLNVDLEIDPNTLQPSKDCMEIIQKTANRLKRDFQAKPLPEQMSFVEFKTAVEQDLKTAEGWIHAINNMRNNTQKVTAVDVAIHRGIPIEVVDALWRFSTTNLYDMTPNQDRCIALIPFLPMLQFQPNLTPEGGHWVYLKLSSDEYRDGVLVNPQSAQLAVKITGCVTA